MTVVVDSVSELFSSTLDDVSFDIDDSDSNNNSDKISYIETDYNDLYRDHQNQFQSKHSYVDNYLYVSLSDQVSFDLDAIDKSITEKKTASDKSSIWYGSISDESSVDI